MREIKLKIIAFLLAGSGFALQVSAVECPTGTLEQGSTGVCVPTPAQTGLSNAQITAIMLNIANWLLGFVAALAVLMIVIAGVMYITAAGDEERSKTAQKILTWAIVGLVVAILALVIVKVVSLIFGAGPT